MSKKKPQTYAGSIPSYERVSTYPEYWKLIEWLATPSPMRNPATQRELAKVLSIHYTTLSRWQAIPECYGDVRKLIKRTLRSDLADVFYALRNKIYKDGSAGEIKLFLQWVDDFVEKQELDVKTPDGTPSELRQLANEFEVKLKEVLVKKK